MSVKELRKRVAFCHSWASSLKSARASAAVLSVWSIAGLAGGIGIPYQKSARLTRRSAYGASDDAAAFSVPTHGPLTKISRPG